jgi:murein DD-endopeptidase MepM/ murein hydrolase activator NlpD
MLPAFLGVFVAVLLGGTGFGLGCLYAEIAGPPPAMLVAANPGSAHPAASLRAPPPVVTDGMGGPDEAAPPMTAARPVSLSNVPAAPGPSSYAPGQLGRTLAMARPVWGGWISSHYGQRTDPFTGRPAIHRGLDFAGLDNSAILAVAPGVVTWSGRQRGYGNLIEIDHGHGWITRYGHNAANLVAVGDYVKPGQTIALMGSTGRATGTHLHFEVLYRGRHQNPARFVPQDA